MEHQELTTVETAKDLGLLPEEFERIKEILGRVPNFTELSIFAVMWSEHCSYKNSITWLKTLPKDSDRMLAKAGEENAGLVDLGDGIGCAFKIESHNHPSALEPYQGAATGVGGINRDIFTMGARPIAQLNSLRFGDLSLDKTKWLVKGVVKGISHYGNAFGIPTVGGELFFDDCYNVNPLVNAMSAGIVKAGETVSATSYGVGNPVYIVGSATGKDGIHGAAFASKDITADSVNDLPAVQVGDPFQEKLLLEASLEVIKTGAVVGMQDMGAAGIICSNSEMSAKGEHGMRIDLDKVPTRQAHMKPYEILLSESQERMLIVVHKGREKDVEAVFEKWDLNCAIIGEVTDTQRLEYFMNGEKVADVPADDLVLGGGAPVYEREYREPAYYAENQKFNIDDVAVPANLVEVAEHLAAHPNLASKRWVTDQYDSMVGVQTMTANLACDAAVVAVKDTDKAIVLTTDCNSRYVYADPYKGTAIAVAEAARNITCAGGEPVAITNCLNFGNPYIPEVYWQFVSAIKGMGDACRKFETPVTGGNVSFYNQSADGGSVFPTPTIGMLGVMEDVSNIMTADFKQPGDLIYLIGESVDDIASSQYLASWHKVLKAPAPYFDIDKEYEMQQAVKGLIKHRVIESAHDVADGGLYIALLESSMPNGLGFDIETDDDIRKDAFLFGEAQGRVVVTVAPEEQERFIEFMATSDVEFSLLGTVNNGFLNVDEVPFGHVTDLKMVHANVLHTILGE
ncbi:phosphoribosylformylglycinamidine synthase subunit PurL [Mucilaginibacter sp. SP1R1]|uniref:phosphoribosylformylglycinamidine synthase subunit PurL n=1 Tax=Mucilaginibacter sp. SP1R1 TaxID=2723091 RepID=UPI0016098CF2|nr:phosphoribosylformylglycinamidine synthase subunit PurL [Mucilaginibacter sp. SP1R1]MBB6148091.1 phosphoribosylformylglycinamidine synthase [Mucilaginibacter sp. SP1R1]